MHTHCERTSCFFGYLRQVPASDYRSNVYLKHCTCIPNVYIHYYLRTGQKFHVRVRNPVILLAIREKCRPLNFAAMYFEHCTRIANVYTHYYIRTSQYFHVCVRKPVILLAIREKCRPVTIVDHLRRRQATALIVDRSKHMLPKRKVPKEGLWCCSVLQCVAV